MPISTNSVSDLLIEIKGFHSLLTMRQPIILPKQPDQGIGSTDALAFKIGSETAKIVLGDRGCKLWLRDKLVICLQILCDRTRTPEGYNTFSCLNKKEVQLVIFLCWKYLDKKGIEGGPVYDPESPPRPWDTLDEDWMGD